MIIHKGGRVARRTKQQTYDITQSKLNHENPT